MKKTPILIIVILIISTAGLFSACRLVGSYTSTTKTPAGSSADSFVTPTVSYIVPVTDGIQSSQPIGSSASANASAPVTAASAASASGFIFEEKTYSEGTITIKYPQITGMSDGAAQEKLNKIISDTALRDLGFLESGTEYDLNYKVTFDRPTVVSMYFDGYGYTPGAAHPYQFLRSVTLDTEKQETVPLPALVSISEGFVDVLLSGKYSSMGYDMTDEYRSSIKDYLTEMGPESWVSALRKADSESAEVCSYLDEGALVISVSAPHVMGDHVEISLAFNDLRGYQTDNLIWKEIEK